MSDSPIWFITGCSGGLGLALARAVLAHGHRLIASSRNPSKTPGLVQEITSQGGQWIALDTTADNLEEIVTDAEAVYGYFDVVVNNAGYPICGAFEDLSLTAARAEMETNFWGPVRIMKTVLPRMRTRLSGTIVNVSSTAGLRTLPTYTHYSSTKHALEAISEGLALEVAQFNVRIQLVEPGAFRTNFLGKDNIQYAPLSEGYKTGVCADMLNALEDMDGKQVGDPVAAAERIWEVVMEEGMAREKGVGLRLPLGSDSVKTVREKIGRVKRDVDRFEDIARSTDVK
ncbi:putative short chain oxidoreductase/dehydrogenase [Aspergillus pseudoustus]|uniref:Short chain oxidoreductase/dehydrogenase n=1 Tax=Aspergillus pseudoustus TaxID=1810923 RepID=A0ABR4IBK4_9EURO